MKFTKKLIGKKLTCLGSSTWYTYVIPIEQYNEYEYWCLHKSSEYNNSKDCWEMLVVPMDKENWKLYK